MQRIGAALVQLDHMQPLVVLTPDVLHQVLNVVECLRTTGAPKCSHFFVRMLCFKVFQQCFTTFQTAIAKATRKAFHLEVRILMRLHRPKFGGLKRAAVAPVGKIRVYIVKC